jgi:hypothetical protein
VTAVEAASNVMRWFTISERLRERLRTTPLLSGLETPGGNKVAGRRMTVTESGADRSVLEEREAALPSVTARACPCAPLVPRRARGVRSIVPRKA